MENNWLYYGVFFDEPTKKNILNYVKRWFFSNGKRFPEDWKAYCDHMTIVFNDGSETAQAWAEIVEPCLGVRTDLEVVSVGVSNRAIAVGIDHRTNNKYSHVTVAVAPGAKPVESNYITNWYSVNDGFKATAGVYKKVTKK